MTSKAPIDFYFEFSSPYGYIASQLADDFEKRVGRPLRWRPFLLGPVFRITGQPPLVEIPMKGEYSRHDFLRSARMHKVPYKQPSKFPIGTVAAMRAFYWLDDRDPTQARAWEEQTVKNRPYRPKFFGAFADTLNAWFQQPFAVLELGSGPGHLAEAIMSRCPVRSYTAPRVHEP